MPIQPARRLDAILSKLERLEQELPHSKLRDLVHDAKNSLLQAFREAGSVIALKEERTRKKRSTNRQGVV